MSTSGICEDERSKSHDQPMETAKYTICTVPLQPGLPKTTENDMAPPAYIPFSGVRNNNRISAGTPARKNSTYYSRTNRQVSDYQVDYRNGSTRTPKRAAMQHFQLVSPFPFSHNETVQIRGIKTQVGAIKYPLLLCSQEGTIMLSLAEGVIVELCTDSSFRIVCNNDFMAYVNSSGTVSDILHKYAKLIHADEYVHCKFVNANERFAALGSEGILFSMQNLNEAYLLSNLSQPENRPAVVTLAKPEFPIQNVDYTLQHMYECSQMGEELTQKCNDIVNKAGYERKPDGSLTIHINGMLIKSNFETGDISIDAKPVRITFNSKTLAVHLRTSHIDMAVQDRDKCYVKRADKRIHTSRSGMVISDGTCTISMDQFGRILSCS